LKINQKQQLHDIRTNEVEEETKSKKVFYEKDKIDFKKIRKVPLSGQSYNPSFADHQTILAEAVALEVKKEQDEQTNVIAKLNPSNDIDSLNNIEDEDELSSGDEGELMSLECSTKKKLKTKLTRAQLNKRRARKIAEFEKLNLKKNESIIKSINQLPFLLKQMKKAEKLKKEEKLALEKTKQEYLLKSQQNSLDYHEVSSVPLSDELQGSLRRLIPKGIAVKNQVHVMRTEGHLMKTDRRVRTRLEKPHKSRRMHWHLRHKLV
jgi:nucleolar protein 53